MLFVAIVKGEVSLISLPASLSFVYRRATDVLELILYPATVLKELIICRSSLVEFLGSLMYTIIAIARTSRTILKRYGESGQPCHVPDFNGMALSFSPFSLMLAVGLL